MCGIFGIWNLEGSSNDLSAVHSATAILRHRGPDDEGYLLVNTRTALTVSCGGCETDSSLSLPALNSFKAEHFDLAFGFRRLSIQDLSSRGHQPMSSSDGSLWIVFNGEIYNYPELRTELTSYGHHFQTGTDTEVILAAYRQWGAACLQRFNGMWAFVVWDARTKSLFAARDRFGEKPLHYVYKQGRMFAFASEIKGLWAAGIASSSVHDETRSLFAQHGQLDCGEQTFYNDVFRLPQGHYLVVNSEGMLRKQRYWDIDPRDQEEGRRDSWYSDQFRQIFFESVRLRLRSDVAVGSSLSGGLDSSTVVCVMDKVLAQGATQKTFSARFDVPALDEGQWIEKVTSVTRVEPHFVWPTGERFIEELDRVFWHQDEPFSSTSIYAQWCVMRLAREQDVTVLLDGQGADESLAGYHSYFSDILDELLMGLNLRAYWRFKRNCYELHGQAPASLKRAVKQSIPRSIRRPVRGWLNKVKGLTAVEPMVPLYPAEFHDVSALKKALWWNTTRQGLVELLRYADRNSMAHSREVRLPFLDHELIEFIFKLPDRFLVREGWTKWILRESFKGIVPDAISNRVDKIGYLPPQERWLGGKVWKEMMLSQLAQGYSDTSGAALGLEAALMRGQLEGQ